MNFAQHLAAVGVDDRVTKQFNRIYFILYAFIFNQARQIISKEAICNLILLKIFGNIAMTFQ